MIATSHNVVHGALRTIVIHKTILFQVSPRISKMIPLSTSHLSFKILVWRRTGVMSLYGCVSERFVSLRTTIGMGTKKSDLFSSLILRSIWGVPHNLHRLYSFDLYDFIVLILNTSALNNNVVTFVISNKCPLHVDSWIGLSMTLGLYSLPRYHQHLHV